MAIYTPRGLKIRLSVNHTFALMARLYPKVDAFKILKTTEGLELMPTMLVFIVGVVSFYLRLNPYQIGLYALIASVVGALIITFRLFFIPTLLKLATLYSYVSGFGILFIALAIYGFISVGWQGVGAYFIGKFLGLIVNYGIEFWNMKVIHSQIGTPLTLSELNFFTAYCLHAVEVGKTTDITVSDEELTEENWKECFQDLSLKWPEVVRRFTVD